MAWIAPKLLNVFLYPLQGLALVPEPVVGRNVLTIGEKTVWADSIVEGNKYHGIVAGCEEARSFQVRIRVGVEPSPLDEDEDREFGLGRRCGWGVNMKKEAILRRAGRICSAARPKADLSIL